MERDITEAEFLEMLQSRQRHFHKICVEAGIYHGFDLSNMMFDECLFSVDFAGSNFEGTIVQRHCQFPNRWLRL